MGSVKEIRELKERLTFLEKLVYKNIETLNISVENQKEIVDILKNITQNVHIANDKGDLE